MKASTPDPLSFVDHQMASDYYFARATESEAIAKGFTLKAYRGTSRACLFNGSGTAWAATDPGVATSYAVDVHGFFEPVIAVLMINPAALPRLRSEAHAGSPPIFLSLEDGVHVCEGDHHGEDAEGASRHA